MNNFRKITLGLLGATILSLGLYACSNDNEATTTNLSSEKTTIASKEGTGFEDVINRLKTDHDFVLLTENLDKFSNYPKNGVLKDELLKKDELNGEEKELLAKALGFSSVSQAYDFEIKNHEYISNVYRKYDLSRFRNQDLQIIFEGAFEYTTLGRTCAEKFKTCKQGAYAVYGLEMAGCVSAGVGIGALSFWCAGCVGAVVGTGCATAATVHCDSMLDSCQDIYDDCRGK